MTKVGAIDCGTNTVRLLVREDGRDLEQRMRIVRLGAGVDREGRLAPDALARAVDAIADAADRARALESDLISCVATSAVRDAANREEFCDAVRERAGISTRVISGEVEAGLAFRGATEWLAPGPKLVCDIGGGSTELVAGEAEPGPWVSMQLGSVRMTERHLGVGAPTQEQLAAVWEATRRLVTEGLLALGPVDADTFVGVAGTVTTLAAISLGLQAYDPELVHATAVPSTTLRAVVEDLGRRSPQDRIRAFPVIPKGREDVLLAGGVILVSIMEALSVETCIVSERDILQGIAAMLEEEAGSSS